ncbi:unnamed protein product, partial [Phaeothamnion confervicola]
GGRRRAGAPGGAAAAAAAAAGPAAAAAAAAAGLPVPTDFASASDELHKLARSRHFARTARELVAAVASELRDREPSGTGGRRVGAGHGRSRSSGTSLANGHSRSRNIGGRSSNGNGGAGIGVGANGCGDFSSGSASPASLQDGRRSVGAASLGSSARRQEAFKSFPATPLVTFDPRGGGGGDARGHVKGVSFSIEQTDKLGGGADGSEEDIDVTKRDTTERVIYVGDRRRSSAASTTAAAAAAAAAAALAAEEAAWNGRNGDDGDGDAGDGSDSGGRSSESGKQGSAMTSENEARSDDDGGDEREAAAARRRRDGHARTRSLSQTRYGNISFLIPDPTVVTRAATGTAAVGAAAVPAGAAAVAAAATEYPRRRTRTCGGGHELSRSRTQFSCRGCRQIATLAATAAVAARPAGGRRRPSRQKHGRCRRRRRRRGAVVRCRIRSARGRRLRCSAGGSTSQQLVPSLLAPA